ncbi:MAG TPA: hypothetical protein VJ385_07705 [Fibrobacteria bacterium]|nr:hypothetical protein [Fibrobacteria bacterium]
MITKEKLQRYRKFKGDVDKWAASQKDGPDEVLTGADWTEIDKLAQRLKIEKNGFASRDYRAETERILKKTVEGAETLSLFKQLEF